MTTDRELKSKLTQSILRSMLDYDQTTGVFTRKVGKSNQPAGSVAGSRNASGYVELSIDGERHMAHRLAWLYFHGSWPSKFIDHINRNKADNSIVNLRDVTPSVNSLNSKRSDSHYPANWCRQAGNKWYARNTRDGANEHLGAFDTLVEAYAAAATKTKRKHIPNVANNHESSSDAGRGYMGVSGVANRVMRPGFQYKPAVKPNVQEWEAQPHLRPISPIYDAFIGHKKGRLTVVGQTWDQAHWKWVCRCQCGRYTSRNFKSLHNPGNVNDRCCECRHTTRLIQEGSGQVYDMNRAMP